jgi:hypothetical protein
MKQDDHPHLTLVDPQAQGNDDEFVPLPYYTWLERPKTLAIDFDEAATAIHLSHGELVKAAALLKVGLHRLTRLLKQSPRLQRIQQESFEHALIRARAVPIDTLFDDNADQRAKEWASTKVLQSRLAMGDPFSPAPPSSAATALTVNTQSREIIFRWKSPTELTNDDDDDSAA